MKRLGTRVRSWLVTGLALLAVGCRCQDSGGSDEAARGAAASADAPPPASGEPPPQLLYLPDGGDVAPTTAPGGQRLELGTPSVQGCPSDMVSIRGEFCIDRYEAVLVDNASGRRLSPYYAPSRVHVRSEYRRWKRMRLESEMKAGLMTPVPEPPAWQLDQEFEPRAEVRAGEIPNGYVSADLAERACHNAGKRLCRPSEWVTACRGEQDRDFPYGSEYVQGYCNVFREVHPAAVLHGNASIGHLDPRLNLVKGRGGRSLLQPTGATSRCRSQWGQDAAFDMVGNLAEWVDDEEGMFVGGFFSRSSREGCARQVRAHPRSYFDYSLGVRCCLSK
jgi:sulfatase modifying factor 1